uniref:Rubicon Homology domain-containing protein n=1 Tax=Monopterus albus TaxID=43700 RepID=A0A3Q3JTV9_MONAL|nr:protein RUBCNL-like [Monopterus albus]
MMGSCRGMPSSLYRSRYVSWCADSAESPAPANTPVAATEPSHQNHLWISSGSVPLLLLSPPETGGEETKATFSHQCSQPAFTEMTYHKASTHSHHSQLNPHCSSAQHHSDTATNSHSDAGEGDDSEESRQGNLSLPEINDGSKEDAEIEGFHLPRSSPVISRRPRPLSWHGSRPGTPNPPRSGSPSSGSLSLDQCGRLTLSSREDLESKQGSCPHAVSLLEDKKQRYVSASANQNRFLNSWLHLLVSGQQGLAEEHRGRSLTSCDAPHQPDCATSTQNSNDSRWSGIPEFSADIFRTSCELEKENAHFVVVDMVLEVLEGVKWTLSFDQWTSSIDMHQHTDCSSMYTHSHPNSAEDSPPHGHRHAQNCSAGDGKQENNKHKGDETTHSSEDAHTHQCTQDTEEEEAGSDEAERQMKTFSVLSNDSGFEDYGGDATPTPEDSLRHAETLAQQLVMEFRRSWFPSHGPQRGRQSLRSSLQELPGTGSVVVSSDSLAEEIRLRTRMRGSLSWAPPRFQIIFTAQPAHRRSDVVALQHFLCAGCGTKVESRYIKKLRYCHYLGRYFCDCCHSGSESVIPGRVLSCWDFGRYPVSDFSKQLLESVWHQPLFDLTCVGKTLYSRVKELNKFRELQEQLQNIKKLLKACRLSGRVMSEFEQFPAHLVESSLLFSMDDLLRAKKGQLVVQARALLHSAIDHVENCKLCLARGFICEFCRERDVIFPFQRDICRRCPVCKACFHKNCFEEKKCPKCARIQSRKKHPAGSMECD